MEQWMQEKKTDLPAAVTVMKTKAEGQIDVFFIVQMSENQTQNAV